MAVKRDKGKSEYSFDIPEDFVEKFDNTELHKTIRDNKKIYAMTTFGRAVPYHKDGLIEAYRRALFDMVDQRIRYNNKSVKSALIVGHIIGRFHPHGDAAAYQSIVTLTQPWTNNYPLVYGGDSNFGNVLGKPAAHYRYTECKTSEFFDDVCEEIKEEYSYTINNESLKVSFTADIEIIINDGEESVKINNSQFDFLFNTLSKLLNM